MTAQTEDLYDPDEWFEYCINNGNAPKPRSFDRVMNPVVVGIPQAEIEAAEELERFRQERRKG